MNKKLYTFLEIIIYIAIPFTIFYIAFAFVESSNWLASLIKVGL